MHFGEPFLSPIFEDDMRPWCRVASC